MDFHTSGEVGLAGIFGIDVLGFAVLSNHLHVVVRTRPDVVRDWSAAEVDEQRYESVYEGSRIARFYLISSSTLRCGSFRTYDRPQLNDCELAAARIFTNYRSPNEPPTGMALSNGSNVVG